jgi:uncharacterized membrane protein
MGWAAAESVGDFSGDGPPEPPAGPPSAGSPGAIPRSPHAPRQSRPAIAPGEVSSLGLSPHAGAVLCYVAAWASGLLVLAIERQSRYVRFHAWQAFLTFVTLTAVVMVSWTVTILMAFVSPAAFRAMAVLTQVLWIVLFVVWLIALVQSIRGATFRVPVLAGVADRLTSRGLATP